MTTTPQIDLRRSALLWSACVWNWVHAAGLDVVEGNVLLALSDCDEPVDAIEIAAQSRLSLDDVSPALNKLTGRGYAREVQRLHVLTASGHALVAEFERYAV